MEKPKVSPYGSWKSPITADLVGSSGFFGYEDVDVDQHKNYQGLDIYWCKAVAEKGGSCIIRSLDLRPGASNKTVDWTPEGFNARTRVHEYGGGSFFVHARTVFFSNMEDQALYKQTSPTATPERVTQTEDHFFADGVYSTLHGRIYIVREDHSCVKSGTRKEAENTIICIEPSTGTETVVASGADFYSSPRLSVDSRLIAWVEWNHPNMPWDNTRIMVAHLDANTKLIDPNTTPLCYVGGTDESPVSAILPCWTKNNQLLYMSDASGYYNLWLAESPEKQKKITDKECDLAFPPWVFRVDSYAYNPQTDQVVIAEPRKGFTLLKDVTSDEPEEKVVTLTHDLTDNVFVTLGADGTVFSVGFSTSRPVMLIRTDLKTGEVTVLNDGNVVLNSIDPGYLSIPRFVKFPTEDGDAYGWFYEPKNKDFVSSEGSKPPLLVRAHGGPTGCAMFFPNLAMLFWTSRGFAVLDVDYRGSSGYGREYRNSLQGNWGLHDVADCCAGAQYLVKEKLVDGEKLCIDGGSAGGYTTLSSLAFRDVFKAGASYYGVGDLELLVKDTHKFESRYLDGLIGKYPEMVEIYHARSAFYHADRLTCPVIFFQGDEDVIVPPNQAESMHKILKEKGVPCAYILYPGEQHGFRKDETIIHSLLSEFYFFSRVFDFEPADKNTAIPIDNMQ